MKNLYIKPETEVIYMHTESLLAATVISESWDNGKKPDISSTIGEANEDVQSTKGGYWDFDDDEW